VAKKNSNKKNTGSVPSFSFSTQQYMRQETQIFPAVVPNIVSYDELAVMSDDDVIGRLRVLEDDRNKVLNASMDPRLWENELAYIKRELQIRRSRREAHDEYCYALEREYGTDQYEDDLPVADLDNSYFLRLVGEMN